MLKRTHLPHSQRAVCTMRSLGILIAYPHILVLVTARVVPTYAPGAQDPHVIEWSESNTFPEVATDTPGPEYEMVSVDATTEMALLQNTTPRKGLADTPETRSVGPEDTRDTPFAEPMNITPLSSGYYNTSVNANGDLPLAMCPIDHSNRYPCATWYLRNVTRAHLQLCPVTGDTVNGTNAAPCNYTGIFACDRVRAIVRVYREEGYGTRERDPYGYNCNGPSQALCNYTRVFLCDRLATKEYVGRGDINEKQFFRLSNCTVSEQDHHATCLVNPLEHRGRGLQKHAGFAGNGSPGVTRVSILTMGLMALLWCT